MARTRLPLLQVSENHRFLSTSGGEPFFWQADTGWMLLRKLTREEAEGYLENRRQKGFNVIQAMLVHDLERAVNAYGDRALDDQNLATPLVTLGADPLNPEQYDFWDHVDYVVDLAASKGIYMALVPVWGSNVQKGRVTVDQGRTYAAWLANRYKNRSNIVWLNGGDVDASPALSVWRAIGETLKREDPSHLVTFHPRGRMQSSDWFHTERWLDFNMFQSGHRTYDQDDTKRNYGEDNWRYVRTDYELVPTKPTLDGEPSYEGIPRGLHDASQPRWTNADVRRYAYWSVFAGGCGFSYGNNAVMQFHELGERKGAFGVHESWREAIDAPGASEMVHVKNLMLSRPYFERVPNQSLVVSPGARYDYLAATSGSGYAFIYTYNGRAIEIAMDRLGGTRAKASWYDPRTGQLVEIGAYDARGTRVFDPPGAEQNGNDWILVLDGIRD